MLRAGPFSDERVIRLANRRFVCFYFDLSPFGAAGDKEARDFVVARREEYDGPGVPTPDVLFMTSDGEELASVSNYASEQQIIETMLRTLAKNPEYNKKTVEEQSLKGADLAEFYFDLHQEEAADKVLEGAVEPRAHYLRGHLARLKGNWKAAEDWFAKVERVDLLDDVKMERAYKLWNSCEYEKLRSYVSNFPRKSNRFTEAAYYLGLANYHLGDKETALATWKQTIGSCVQDRWIYRADWAYTSIRQGRERSFSTVGKKHSLLGRHGYMGRDNPDLKRRPEGSL